MGLRITRSQRQTTFPPIDSASSKSSVWSARELAPIDVDALCKPDASERIVPDANGHLGTSEVAKLFDHLWSKLPRKACPVVELDMQDVKTYDEAFSRELEFYRRELQRRAGTVRLVGGDQFEIRQS